MDKEKTIANDAYTQLVRLIANRENFQVGEHAYEFMLKHIRDVRSYAESRDYEVSDKVYMPSLGYNVHEFRFDGVEMDFSIKTNVNLDDLPIKRGGSRTIRRLPVVDK
jgi:hypothetical protein